MSELARALDRRRRSIEDPSAAREAVSHAARLDEMASRASSGALDVSASPSDELQNKLARRRRLSDSAPDAREVRQAVKRAQNMQAKNKKQGDHFDKVSGELGKKFEKQLFKEKVAEFRTASNIDSEHDEDSILAKVKRVSSSSRSETNSNVSPELASKLRRRRQSMGEEEPDQRSVSGSDPIQTPGTHEPASSINSKKNSEVELKQNDIKNPKIKSAKAVRGKKTKRIRASESEDIQLVSSVCDGHMLSVFAVSVLVLFVAYFIFIMKSIS